MPPRPTFLTLEPFSDPNNITMAIEAFLATKAQKAFLFTVCLQAVILLTMVGIVYGNVGLIPLATS
jgi:hypothetical protein